VQASRCVCTLAAVFLLGCVFSYAQLGHPAVGQSQSRTIHLDVVVTGRGDAPASGLTQSDFTILDNGIAQKIDSFQPMTGDACPVEVIIVLDDVNTGYTTLSYARQQMEKFFQSNGGKLPYLTSLAIFSDTRTEITKGFTLNGTALSKALDNYTISQRAIRWSAGIEGASERMDLSMHLLRQLIAVEGRLEGRKIILWVSPGWAFFSGPQVQTTVRQQKSLFRQIEFLSNELRQARITLYVVNPQGTDDPLGNFYQSFLKPVRKLNQAQLGNLSLQTLTVHSGGLAFYLNNDIAGLMQKTMDDVQYFYELTYTAPAGEPDEYHSIQVKVAKPGLKARTTTGYYAGN
jgi:VWFA-related protein